MKRTVTLLAIGFLAILEATSLGQQAKVPDAVKKAQAKLVDSPDDPDANLTLGKYLAFDTGEWDKALPLLAKGSDKGLAAIAQKDIEGATTGPLKVGIGDGWVDLQKKFPKNRASILERASKWYADAWQDLDSVWKTKMREQLKKLNAVPADPEKRIPNSAAPTGWSALGDVYGTFIDESFAHSGRKSLKVAKPGNKDPSATNLAGTVSIPTKGAKKHELTFFYLTDGTDSDINLQILFKDAAGKQCAKEGGMMLLSDEPWWHHVRVEIDSPDEAIRVAIAVSGKLKKGAGWLDDFSLKVEGKELFQNGGLEDK